MVHERVKHILVDTHREREQMIDHAKAALGHAA
jgi:hypothetical protein